MERRAQNNVELFDFENGNRKRKPKGEDSEQGKSRKVDGAHIAYVTRVCNKATAQNAE